MVNFIRNNAFFHVGFLPNSTKISQPNPTYSGFNVQWLRLWYSVVFSFSTYYAIRTLLFSTPEYFERDQDKNHPVLWKIFALRSCIQIKYRVLCYHYANVVSWAYLKRPSCCPLLSNRQQKTRAYSKTGHQKCPQFCVQFPKIWMYIHAKLY